MSKAVWTALRAAPKQLSIPFNKLPALQSNCASKKFGVLKSPLMLELESSTSAIACSFLLSEKERGYFKKINRIIFFNQRHSKTGPYCRKSFKENGGWKCQSRANYLCTYHRGGERWTCDPRVSGSSPGAGNLKKLLIWMKIHGLPQKS